MKDDEQYIYWEDLTDEEKEKSTNKLKQIQSDLNKKFRDEGVVTLREVIESIGFEYEGTAYEKCEATGLGRWQYGGSKPELHFEETKPKERRIKL